MQTWNVLHANGKVTGLAHIGPKYTPKTRPVLCVYPPLAHGRTQIHHIVEHRGVVLYEGTSEHVARLIANTMIGAVAY